MKKKVKAWAILLTDKKRFECAFDSKSAAEVYTLQFYGAEVVECEITYTVPPKNTK